MPNYISQDPIEFCNFFQFSNTTANYFLNFVEELVLII